MAHPLYWIALQCALGIPSKKWKVLCKHFADPEDVFNASEEELCHCKGLTPKERNQILARPYEQAKKIWYRCKENNISILTPEDAAYPAPLWDLPDMPLVLYYQGEVPDLAVTPTVGLVGTRRPSPWGRAVVAGTASVLASAGFTVVSGGALGIDGVAHRSALQAGGKSILVMPCGMTFNYLSTHKELRRQVAENGWLVTEYPPDCRPNKRNFPDRNRLIAALSKGLAVCEAGAHSGTFSTAVHAMHLQRLTFVLSYNGNIDGYPGNRRLINEYKARWVYDGMEILKYFPDVVLTPEQQQKAKEAQREYIESKHLLQPYPFLDPVHLHQNEPPKPVRDKLESLAFRSMKDIDKQLYIAVERLQPVTVETLIIENQQYPPGQVMAEMIRMEVMGYFTKGPRGFSINEDFPGVDNANGNLS